MPAGGGFATRLAEYSRAGEREVSEDISGRKQEKKERQAEESRPRMKREEARLRHCREMLKGSGKG